jgi:HK97 family phage portal protein
MGIFDFLRRKGPATTEYAKALSGSLPIFSQFGDDIYASDVVRQAISCIVQEMKKLQPLHMRKSGDERDAAAVGSGLQRVLDAPNPVMTTSELMEKIVWELFFNYNSFVVPTYEANGGSRRLTALWPVQPSQVDFLESGGKIYVRMRFANNYETTLDYGDVVHIRYDFSVNEYMGGNAFGRPDHGALAETLKMNKALWQGVDKSIRAQLSINGVIKYNALLDGAKIDRNIKDLETRLQKGEHGFLPIDLKGEFVPFKREVEFLPPETLKFVDEKILRNFGVPLAILRGDFTKDQYEAFYQKTLEPLIVQLGQSFTKALFSDRERGTGNRIVFNPSEMVFMTPQQKIEFVRLVGDRGTLFENEIRVTFGLPPLPELEGVRMQSLNYVDSRIAPQYQVGPDAQKEDGQNAKEA